MGMFKNTLLLAQQGNEKAMEKLLNRYDPLLKALYKDPSMKIYISP
ncbi:MAG: helix-turn-helix domain-containing protein [Phascolarctobacterium sp.]